uniref:Uncharacterized protein n=1 Tax=Arundo donax TaxID=35708 RepID=A0A0A9B6U3_ARUDO
MRPRCRRRSRHRRGRRRLQSRRGGLGSRSLFSSIGHQMMVNSPP